MPNPISEDQERLIVDQLLLTLRDYYVHLPLKMKAFAIDPVQELELLKDRMDSRTQQGSFYLNLKDIFLKLRDRHTTLSLPFPWRGITAFLPFMIERYYENDEPVYVISKKILNYDNPYLPEGSVVTHWNGIKIDLYVEEVLGPIFQGANADAASLLALANLTVRSLGFALPPFEDWVTLSYVTPDRTSRALSIPWKFFMQPEQETANSLGSGLALTGLDEHAHHVSIAKKTLYTRGDGGGGGTSLDYLRFSTLNMPGGPVGYLRIFSFEVGDLNTYLQNIVSILESLPQDRLIVDIRSNPGGIIPAGQMLVQLLCPRQVTLSPVGFRNTPETLQLTTLSGLESWHQSVRLMNETGELFSQNFPLTDLSMVPGYRYPGRVAWLIDSLCYSTSDFATADFKDNRVGIVIGTDSRTTGGGGANVWPQSLLAQYARMAGNTEIQNLPFGMSLNIAMRRSLRTGDSAGLPVEDLGVEADFVHDTTRNDLLNGNQDLIAFACSKLL